VALIYRDKRMLLFAVASHCLWGVGRWVVYGGWCCWDFDFVRPHIYADWFWGFN